MSMTSHPLAFGTIEHTERAGELLGLLWQEVLRLQCDLKDAQADTKRLDWLMANSGLILGHGWWALKTYADTSPDDQLGVLDWIDAAMVRADDADARNEELAARWPLAVPARTVQSWFLYACRRLGIEDLRFHDLRHSAASAMINAGVPVYTVGAVLGHKAAASTKRYSHLDTAALAEAVKRIG